MQLPPKGGREKRLFRLFFRIKKFTQRGIKPATSAPYLFTDSVQHWDPHTPRNPLPLQCHCCHSRSPLGYPSQMEGERGWLVPRSNPVTRTQHRVNVSTGGQHRVNYSLVGLVGTKNRGTGLFKQATVFSGVRQEEK